MLYWKDTRGGFDPTNDEKITNWSAIAHVSNTQEQAINRRVTTPSIATTIKIVDTPANTNVPVNVNLAIIVILAIILIILAIYLLSGFAKDIVHFNQ